jgi:hypothetical protein
MKWRFPKDPPGYRMASGILTQPAFDSLEYLSKSQVQEAAVVPARSVFEWKLAPRINQSLFTCKSDIWTIVPLGRSSVLPMTPRSKP